MIVDYGASNQVCKVEVPARMPSNEAASNELVQNRRMYAFLEEVVPGSMRGNELRRGAVSTGMHSMSFIEYEYVTIGESRGSSNPRDNTITVTFQRDECQKPQ